MAVNVAAMLLVFIALIAMLSSILGGVGDITGINSWIESNTFYKSLSIEFILGYLFSPLMWVIGVAKQDIALMGQLLGIKLVASEFVGYTQLVDLKNGLNNELPDGISRYNDVYNPNCVGDSFTSSGIPTILFEAGHYPDDYDRTIVTNCLLYTSPSPRDS